MITHVIEYIVIGFDYLLVKWWQIWLMRQIVPSNKVVSYHIFMPCCFRLDN